MEKKKTKTKRKQKLARISVLAIAMASLLLAAILPSSAITAKPLSRETSVPFTPFTMYATQEFNSSELHQSPIWEYGVDFTEAVDTSKFYDSATGALEYEWRVDNRGDGYYETDEYSVWAYQGAYPFYNTIDETNPSLGDYTQWVYNTIWTNDGFQMAGSMDENQDSGRFTKHLHIETPQFFYSSKMADQKLMSEIKIIPYFRVGVADSIGMDCIYTTWHIEFIDPQGTKREFDAEGIIRNGIEESFVASAVNYSPRSSFYGYQRSTNPGTAGELLSCSVPVFNNAFLDYAFQNGSDNESVIDYIQILECTIDIDGYNYADYQADPETATKYSLQPIVLMETEKYENGNFASRFEHSENPFSSIISNARNDAFNDGYNDGYNEGINESWEGLNFTNFLGIAVGGFLDTPLFGAFSIGGMLAVVVGLALLIAFLKFFAGG